MLALWENLQRKGFKYFLTNRLNQDCVEKFSSPLSEEVVDTEIIPTVSNFELHFDISLLTNCLCTVLLQIVHLILIRYY